MATIQSAVQQLLLPSAVIFLFLGSVFAIVAGAGLILRGEATLRLFGKLNRWVSTREALKTVDQQHDIEQTMHRRQRLLGAVFLALAALSFIVLVAKYDVAVLSSVFARRFPPIAVELAVVTLKWTLIAGDILAIIVGAALILSPDVLAKVEARTNRWYSTRTDADDAALMHLTLDKWAEKHARAAGWIVIVLAAFVALNLGIVLIGPR
ncbi:MAG: hypothetical protein Q8O56_01375 [Solirubrobacteraceae bacterium]|nr:hypothetical protein [Solirubrobacteraceae bacterium]